MLLYVSDFDLRSSGYMQISIALCRALAERGHKVMALGLGYDGAEHNWPFSIIPVQGPDTFGIVQGMMQNIEAITQSGQLDPVEAIIVALDIPLQDSMLQRLGQLVQNKALPQRWPYIGIYPIESGPLCTAWANILTPMDERLVISQYGLKCMEEKGVAGHFLPVGLDTASWRLPLPDERAKLRKAMGFTDDQLVVLTVADNQERKNLWIAAETVKRLPSAQWILVTRVNSPVGWKIPELAWQCGIQERMMSFDRGMAFDKLWTLYAVSDAFLLTSKAEGFGMPMIEAMACGVPVVATDCTAIPEQVWDDYPANTVRRGFPIRPNFWNLDPWGNSMRAWADPDNAAVWLDTIAGMKRNSDPELVEIIKRGRAYAESRTWQRAAGIVADAVERCKRTVAPAPPLGPDIIEINPNTVPTPVPILGGPA